MKSLMTVELVEEDDGELNLMISPDDAADGARLEQFLRAVAGARERMQPPVATSPTTSMGTVPLVQEPPRYLLMEVFSQGLVLSLRHPGFGWLSFQVPPDLPKALQRAHEESAQLNAQIQSKPN